MSSDRRRADTLLAERGLAPSRSAAAASVRAGRVRLGGDGPAVSKPSQLLPGDAELIVDEGPEFVSRGGTKLANALDSFEDRGDPIAVDGRDCLDVGASTGGFTDCLLSRGGGARDRARRRLRAARLGPAERRPRRGDGARERPDAR